MATQNIAVPTGEGAGIFAALATHILENHGPEIGDAVINKNFVLAYLRKKAESVEVGGLDFAEPVLTTANSNFAHRSHYTDIPATIQDPTREFKFDPVSLTGSIVLNKKHELMNQGRHAIKKLMNTLKLQAETTIDNTINTAMWAASPTANVDPESIRSLVSATPTTGTIGGISRVGNTYAQNKVYTTAVTTIGGAAGLAAMHGFRATLGGDAKTAPDFAVTTSVIWGLLVGYIDTLRRLQSDEQMTKLGVEQFYVTPGCLLGYDGNGGTGECPSNYLYFLNSKHLFFKVLEGSLFKFEPFSYKGNNLNLTSLFYMFYNLTTNLPSSMGVMTNITG